MAKFDGFPEGVLEEIMSRLPPESLMRLKCVCKSWYVLIKALINDPTFVAKHPCNMTKMFSDLSRRTFFSALLAINEPEPEGKEIYVEGAYLLTMATDDFEYNDCVPCVEDFGFLLQYFEDHYLFRLAGHCRGIICLLGEKYENDLICLLNPALKEFKIVLNGSLDDGFKIVAVGFGWDSRADDYKVVIIKSPETDDYSFEAELYTLSTDSWKEIELGVEIVHFAVTPYQTLYCNGVCYWYYYTLSDMSIIAFDVGDEIFHSIPLPQKVKRLESLVGSYGDDEWDDIDEWSQIAVWNNSIVLFFYGKDGPSTVIDMWVMSASSRGVETAYTWTKYLTMGLLEGIKRPLTFLNDDWLYLETEDSGITSCNIRTCVLNDDTIPWENFRSSLFVVYARSLVSVLKRGGKRLAVKTIRPVCGASSS